jgi:hypothetical protein
MQNKWYVGGMVIPAMAAAGVTIWCAATGNWVMALVPGAVALGLFRGAWWAGHSQSFTSVSRQHVDVGTSVAVARWNQHCADRDAAAKAAKTADVRIAPPKV